MPTDLRKLPPLFSRDALHPAVIARAERSIKEKPGEHWCVAFSGGADSLALLLTIWTNWPEKRSGLVGLHFNHRLRGKESDEDAIFCREICEKLGVDFRFADWTDANAGASEADARAARLGFFAKEMARIGTAILWTGHQKDDVAETLLMRLARGSGSAGLAAPRPVQMLGDGRVFLRPLLTLTKTAILAALSRADVAWREDATNVHGDFFRNRMRNDVVPKWRAASENDAVAGAALTRELLDDDDTALSAWLAELLPAIDYDGDVLNLCALNGKPRALVRRALRQWKPLRALARAGFEEVLRLFERGDSQVSAGEGIVEIRSSELRFKKHEGRLETETWASAGLQEGAILFLPDGGVLTARVIAFTTDIRQRIGAKDVDPRREVYLAEVNSGLRVRPRQAGDRYRPLGFSGAATVQDLFVNRKIPAERRGQLPVIVSADGEILWIPGFPPAEESKMTTDSVTGLHLTYETGTYTVRP